MNHVHYTRLVVVGVGGGWRTPRDLAFFLSYFMTEAVLVIVDGGVYRSRQRDHEHFAMPGNKARIQAEFVRDAFPGLGIEAIRKYVATKNGEQVVSVEELLLPGDVVFLQVDNNRTRNLVAEHARQLSDVTLISGGTNEDQLRVMVYLRRGHQDITPPFSAYCDEIARPADESPSERLSQQEGCFEQIEAEHVHPFTMLATSTFMLNAFYAVWKLESAGRLADFPFQELWYDIATGRCRTEVLIPVNAT